MPPVHWKILDSLDQFDEVLENSRTKPVLIFKHQSTSKECNDVKKRLESDWDLTDDQLDLYILDDALNHDMAEKITESSGVEHELPQILLFADGVTMYDESHEMINVKKIKIALKIINRTFKWMESRA